MSDQKKIILKQVRIIRENNNLSQELIAEKMNITQSKYARFERGETKTDLDTLVDFCKVIGISFKEFIIYPDKLGKNDNEEPIKAILQIELKSDKKEQILKLVFGENNLEILNR
ncbi:helix-turn-helix transcriptional regulator [Flavobacterium sp.]|uniref:helix-turn-helix domain-containing protein n=1 Tax=Flavobacterium sp. TaxID=239 RepID=UPI00286E57C5|nr:helix-turn-helix transcriptional regulator [Flavobacterium sp.]